MEQPPRAIFISWFPYHGRSEGIARALGIRGWFSDGGRGPSAIRDMRRWCQTTRLLRAEKPDVVIVMQPPVVALWCVWWYARRSRTRIAGDLHTGVFTEPRTRMAMRHTLRLLRRHGLAIVTNDALRDIADEHQCPALVLHDHIEVCDRDSSRPDHQALADLADVDYVLVPLSYAHDEPIAEILEAAGATPDLRWVLTGRPPRNVVSRAPRNVTFPGYVSDLDFRRAMSRASVVVAMTTHENTMQRAAYEALNMGRPLVTSNTAVLSAFYGGAAELVAPRAEFIARGVLRTITDAYAQERVTELRDRRIGEQESAMAALRQWVSAGGR